MFEKDLLNFCKNSMSIISMFGPVKKRVIKFVSIQSFLLIVSIILLIIFKRSLGFIFIFLDLFLLQSWITAMFFINMYYKKYIWNEYQIKFESKDWHNFKYLLLKNFLFHKKILNKPSKNKSKNIQSLDFCIERFEKYIEEKNKKKFITVIRSSSALFLAFFVALWTSFNNWVFQKHTFNLGQATAYSVGIVIFLVFIILLVVIIRYYVILFSFEEERISYLIEMLHGIKFSLNNSYYLDPIENENLNKLITEIIKNYDLKARL
ncbi:hypothetical protein [Bacillus thuringiensis]|uniref:hypothetical protein n=1 Tax=Bacillus thuringiensis TaxID=1428 RepID=UPI000BF93D26|nr:hypothetical protein [Bacillus thuringiensis]PER51161.1 hypothetical protein CN486_27650 [Bacillus thuringiensis]